MTTIRKILIPTQALIYGIIFVLGLLACFGSGPYVEQWNESQARIICVGAITAIVGSWAPILVEKLLKVKLTGLIDIILALDLFLSIVLGECFKCYRIIPNYDKFLHAFGTAQISIVGYAVSRYFLAKTNKGTHQTLMCLIFAFFFGIAIQAIWELYEFTVDCIAGTDMQKYLPDYFEGCRDPNTWELTCSDEEIAAYYKTAEGYHFAVMDTMFDFVADIVGSLFGAVSCAILFRYKPEMATSFIQKRDENKSDEIDLPVMEPKKKIANGSDQDSSFNEEHNE